MRMINAWCMIMFGISLITLVVEADNEVACVGADDSKTCSEVQLSQSQSGEACDYLTKMAWDCSKCHSCPGGYLMDMPPPSSRVATVAQTGVACVGNGETRTCSEVQMMQSRSGEACDYLTKMAWDCSKCHSCPGGYLMDMGPALATEATKETRHHPEQCREGGGANFDDDCCAGLEDGSCAWGYTKVQKTWCGQGHAWCDAHGCMGYECHEGGVKPILLIVIIVVVVLIFYFGSMIFVFCLAKKAREAARGVPQCGHVPAPAGAVDIPSDSYALDSCFTGMGRPEMLPLALRPYMTPQEYGDLFANINASLRSTMGCRAWHVALWVPMIVFWAIGGFMIMIWGMQRTKNLAVAAIGTHLDPFCKAKGISYVVMVAVQAGKHGGQSHPTVVRIFLPSMVIQAQPLVATVVGYSTA